jgi:hypothetical protein
VEFEDETGCTYPSYEAYFLDKYCSGIGLYDSELADGVFDVINCLMPPYALFYTAICAKIGLHHFNVAVILDVLAHNNLTEYGTSPRGSWLTPEGVKAFELWKKERADEPRT